MRMVFVDFLLNKKYSHSDFPCANKWIYWKKSKVGKKNKNQRLHFPLQTELVGVLLNNATSTMIFQKWKITINISKPFGKGKETTLVMALQALDVNTAELCYPKRRSGKDRVSVVFKEGLHKLHHPFTLHSLFFFSRANCDAVRQKKPAMFLPTAGCPSSEEKILHFQMIKILGKVMT